MNIKSFFLDVAWCLLSWLAGRPADEPPSFDVTCRYIRHDGNVLLFAVKDHPDKYDCLRLPIRDRQGNPFPEYLLNGEDFLLKVPI